MAFQLIWKKCYDSDQARIFWDFGDKRWELKDNSIYHYKILSRKVLSKEPFTLLEEVRELQEEPVPLEAEMQVAKGWSVTQKQIEPLKIPSSQNSSKTVNNKKQQPVLQPQLSQPLLPNPTFPVQHQQVKSEPVEEEFLLYSSSLPTELWLSLSQWIPTNALFQPSLHHQACAELFEQPNQISVAHSIQGTYSRPRLGQHQYSKQALPPRHAPLTMSGQKHKVDHFAKPLFI